uniref:Uncharacterized protein n=1 Tax=viral metagenome TaxID=1070528 RepID=A0A6C0I578_9ZZZZ
MSQFFRSKNNQNKYYIYLLLNKPNKPNDINEDDINEYNNEDKTEIKEIPEKTNNTRITTYIIVTKNIIMHDFNYIINNIDKLIEQELEYKIVEYHALQYNICNEIPSYPYDIFYNNRILLHAFFYACNNINSIKSIITNEKVNIVCNSNYLKRIKDWSSHWRKNRYSIEKYQNLSNETSSETLFSIHTLSDLYFNIDTISIDNNKSTFQCTSMSLEEKSTFERISERPNTDYIEKCYQYFEDDKMIKFI